LLVFDSRTVGLAKVAFFDQYVLNERKGKLVSKNRGYVKQLIASIKLHSTYSLIYIVLKAAVFYKFLSLLMYVVWSD